MRQLFKDALFMFAIIITVIGSMVVAMSPVIPYIITDNAKWMFFLFATIPIGISILKNGFEKLVP